MILALLSEGGVADLRQIMSNDIPHNLTRNQNRMFSRTFTLLVRSTYTSSHHRTVPPRHSTFNT